MRHQIDANDNPPPIIYARSFPVEKRCICVIGYEQYAIDPNHAAVLLQVAMHAKKVTRASFDEPWRPVQDAQPFCTTITIEDFDPKPAPPKPADPNELQY